MTDFTLALAPMEGVTDEVFRDVLTSLGGVDYCVSEFVRVSGESLRPKGILRDCPELGRGATTMARVPVHLQLLGGDTTRMAESARSGAEAGALVVDLNFGCPAPTVNKHDGGATLLKDPRRVQAVTAAVRAAVPAAVRVSAKVRLGWDDPDAVVEIARAAEAGGASWLTVHGRTRAQGYAPPADWVRIGRARAAISIPVVANGDLNSPADIARCAEITGCERFMLGRGAVARPEVFLFARGVEAAWWSPVRRLALLERYAARGRALLGTSRDGMTLARMKQWCRAMAAVEPSLAPCFESVKRTQSVDAALSALAAFRANAGAYSADAGL